MKVFAYICTFITLSSVAFPQDYDRPDRSSINDYLVAELQNVQEPDTQKNHSPKAEIPTSNNPPIETEVGSAPADFPGPHTYKVYLKTESGHTTVEFTAHRHALLYDEHGELIWHFTQKFDNELTRAIFPASDVAGWVIVKY